MKLICFAINVVSLTLLLNSITLQWSETLQYILAIIAPVVWGITSYMEGCNAV